MRANSYVDRFLYIYMYKPLKTVAFFLPPVLFYKFSLCLILYSAQRKMQLQNGYNSFTIQLQKWREFV